MLKSLHLTNFTVFSDATFEFSSGINVLIGENGTGKSHVLKAAYLMIVAKYSIQVDSGVIKDVDFEKYHLSEMIRFQRTFKTKETKNLISFGKEKAEVKAIFNNDEQLSCDFAISENVWRTKLNGGNTKIDEINEAVFIPPKEFLSTYPNFFSLYEKFRIGFDETYFDLSKLLNQPLLRETGELQPLIDSLENIIGGKIVLKGDHFYLRTFEKNGESQDIEIDMIAEGVRKIGMLAYLISNDAIKKGVTIFWDEPEVNLNPRLMRKLAEALIELTKYNIQIILATHSFFFMKEISLLIEKEQLPAQFFNFIKEENGEITINYNEALSNLGNIISVDEEILQYDRTLENF